MNQSMNSQTGRQGDDLGIAQFLDQIPGGKEVSRIAGQVQDYAHTNPMQTIFLTTAAGALVGWLLTSDSGKRYFNRGAHIAKPFVSSWLDRNYNLASLVTKH